MNSRSLLRRAASECQIWRQKLPEVKYAPVPPHSSRSNPVIVGDLVVASIMVPGQIVGMERATGHICWRAPFDGFGEECAIYKDGLLLGMETDSLMLLDPENGKSIWRIKPGPELTQPVVRNRMLYFGDGCGCFHKFDPHAGKWVLFSRIVRLRRPTCVGIPRAAGNVLVWTIGPRAYGISLRDGRKLWQTELDGASAREVLRVGADVAITTMKSVYVLRSDTGTVRQRWTWKGWETWATAAAGSTLIVSVQRPFRAQCDLSSPRTKRSLQRLVGLEEGNILFDIPKFESPAGLRYEPATRTVYSIGKASVSGLNPQTGRRRWEVSFEELGETRDIGPGLPTGHDGVLYLLTQEGTMLALRHP